MRECLLWLFVAGIGQAQTLDSWVDLERGQEPSFTVGYISPELEIWRRYEPTFPLTEVGRLVPVKTDDSSLLLVGYYLSYWSKTEQIYLEPFLIHNRQIEKKWNLESQIGIYLPISNSGKAVVFSPETHLVSQLTDRIQFGIASSFYKQEGAACLVHWGPIARAKIGSSIFLFDGYLSEEALKLLA